MIVDIDLPPPTLHHGVSIIPLGFVYAHRPTRGVPITVDSGMAHSFGVNPLVETDCNLTVRRWMKNGIHFVASPADSSAVGEAATGFRGIGRASRWGCAAIDRINWRLGELCCNREKPRWPAPSSSLSQRGSIGP